MSEFEVKIIDGEAKVVAVQGGWLTRTKRNVIGGTALAGGVLGSAQTYAVTLTADQQTAINTAMTGTGDAVTLIISGLIGVGLLLTGFGLIYSLIKGRG